MRDKSSFFVKLISIAFIGIFLFFCQAVDAQIEKEFNVPLGGYTTPLDSYSDDILHNIKAATSKFHNKILDENQIFSFNKTVGERTATAGYRNAPVLFNNVRIEMPGGGICIVSSTLYAAVLTARLRIIERHKHLLPVKYVPIGMDATVSWGSKDLKFKNSLKQSVKITGEIIGDRLVISIWGTKAVGSKYEIISEINKIAPSETNSDLLPAVESRVYRLKFINDELIEKKFLYRDYYPPRLKE